MASCRVALAVDEHCSEVPTSLLEPRQWHEVVQTLEFSPQQARIVGLLLQDHKDKEIAADLGLSVATVRTHFRHLFARQKVDDRLGLALHVLAIARKKEQATRE